MNIPTRFLAVALVATHLLIDQDESAGLILSPDVGWVAGVLLALVGLQFLADGWSTRRLAKPRDFESHATVVVPGRLPTVWETLVDPQTQVSLNEEVVAAGRLGSARGLGEIQCFVKEDEEGSRRLTALEVMEYEHERRALTKSLVPGMEEHWTETALEALSPDQVRIDVGVRIHARSGMRASGMRSFARTFADHAAGTVRSYDDYFQSQAERQAEPRSQSEPVPPESD